jgi:hypothetical protein
MREELIRSYARRLRIGVLAVFGGVLLLVICGHLGVRIGGAPVLLQSKAEARPGQVTISDGVLLLIGVAIYWLCEGLRAVAAGELFSAAIVRRFRLFALWMLIAALFNTLAPMVLAMAGLGSAGRHRFMVLIDVRDLLLISLTLLILLIARMFERARALQDEMSEIV